MKKSILLLFVVLLSGGVYAQSDDFGIWTSLEAKKELFRRLEASVEGEFRTRDDASTVDRWSGAVGLSYRAWSFLKFGGDYTFIRFNHNKRGWETGHRYNLYVTGSYTWKQFTLSLRERYQHTYRRNVPATATSANPKDVFRSRLQLAYDIPHSNFAPYASIELFHTLNDPQDNGLEKIRYTLGTTYNLDKRNAIGVYYRYQQNKDGDSDIHILGVGYAVKF